jgi:hypothetical protein
MTPFDDRPEVFFWRLALRLTRDGEPTVWVRLMTVGVSRPTQTRGVVPHFWTFSLS